LAKRSCAHLIIGARPDAKPVSTFTDRATPPGRQLGLSGVVKALGDFTCPPGGVTDNSEINRRQTSKI
jgi:hypothetical protein